MDFEKAHQLLDKLSKAQEGPLLRSRRYYPSHSALIKLLRLVQDDPQHDGLLSASCAVYGWMPTILKTWDFANFGVQKPLEAVRSLANCSDAKQFLLQMNTASPINNSWVGASKLLHFVNPEIFPIWDSRIAKHFGLNWAYQFNNRDAYIAYFEFIHAHLEAHAKMLGSMAEHIEDQYGYKPSPVRCLELLFFESPVD